jgi:hypothetical protein
VNRFTCFAKDQAATTETNLGVLAPSWSSFYFFTPNHPSSHIVLHKLKDARMCLPCCCRCYEYDDITFEGMPKHRKSKRHGHSSWELVHKTPIIQTSYISPPPPIYASHPRAVIPSPAGPAPQPLVSVSRQTISLLQFLPTGHLLLSPPLHWRWHNGKIIDFPGLRESGPSAAI